MSQRIGEERLPLFRREVNDEIGQRVPLRLACLAHDRGPDYQAQRVERNLTSVAIRISYPERLQNSVVQIGHDAVTQCVAGLAEKQRIRIAQRERRGAEGITSSI